MLNGDVFVFDNAVHMYGISENKPIRATASAQCVEPLAFRARPGSAVDRTRGNATDTAGIGDGYERRWAVHDMARVVFGGGITDMAMAQAVVLDDVYKDGFAPLRAQYEFASAYPGKVLFCGGVDPLYLTGSRLLRYAMTRQVVEFGARSFAFCNGHVDTSWRCDDRNVAYPMYEHAQSLGVEVLQFHKDHAMTRAPLESLTPLDIEQAALDFPDLIFAIHFASPYFEESVHVAARHANIVLVLSGTVHLPFVAPWDFKTYIGRLLRDVGSDRVLWGSKAPLTAAPHAAVEWFWNMQVDEELQDRHGYPAISESDKRNILGLNQARLYGVDPQSAVSPLATGVTGGDAA
jgi:uncharacterized protein